MTADQKDQIHQQLLRDRAEIVGEIDSLREKDLSTKLSTGADLAERAELEAERSVEHQLSMDDANLLAKIDLALQRLENGTYQQCLNCDAAIPMERLLAKPSVSLCIGCQTKKEAGELS